MMTYDECSPEDESKTMTALQISEELNKNFPAH